MSAHWQDKTTHGFPPHSLASSCFSSLDPVAGLNSYTGTTQDLHLPPALTPLHLLTKTALTVVLLTGSGTGPVSPKACQSVPLV